MNLEKLKVNLPKTILKFAIPSTIAMILTSSITIIDGLFIGNFLGKEAIVAINLGLPILYIYLAVGIMLGVGGSAIATRLLGENKRAKSIAAFNQTILETILFLAILSIIFLVILKSISNTFIENKAVRLFFEKYYLIMLFAYPLMILNTNLGMFIRADGNPQLFMIMTIISTVANAILDHVFISIFNLGISGIALASIISAFIGLICSIFYIKFKSRSYKFHKFTFSKRLLIITFLNGSSELIGQLSVSFTMLILNYVLLREVGITGVAAFTIAGYTFYLFNMIAIGLSQGISPIISFAFGAKDFNLCKDIRKATIGYVFLIGLLTISALNIFPNKYGSLFVNSDSMMQDIIVTGTPIFSLAFLFMGFNIVTTFYFTSIGRAKESVIISISRGLVISLVCICVLPLLWGMTGVWLIAPITELITICLSIMFIIKHDRSFLEIEHG